MRTSTAGPAASQHAPGNQRPAHGGGVQAAAERGKAEAKTLFMKLAAEGSFGEVERRFGAEAVPVAERVYAVERKAALERQTMSMAARQDPRSTAAAPGVPRPPPETRVTSGPSTAAAVAAAAPQPPSTGERPGGASASANGASPAVGTTAGAQAHADLRKPSVPDGGGLTQTRPAAPRPSAGRNRPPLLKDLPACYFLDDVLPDPAG